MENISINSKKEILRLPINTEYISVFSGYINLNICTKTLLINHIKDTFLQYFKIEIKNEDIEISEESDKYYYLVNKYEIHFPDLIYLEKKIIEYFEKYKDHEEEKLEEQLINDDENQTLIDSDKTSISSEDEIEVINNDKKNESLDGFFYLIHRLIYYQNID